MPYSSIEQQVRDLDLFLFDNEKPIHIASGGGQIPTQLAENDVNNENFSTELRTFTEEPPTEIEVNPLLSEMLGLDQDALNDYLGDFIKMAKLGFYSYDKTHLGDFENPMFHLVARPRNGKYSFPIAPTIDSITRIRQTLPSSFESFDLFSYFQEQ